MSDFSYINDELCIENIKVSSLVSEYGSPLYIYSRATIERQWNAFNESLSDINHLVCYAVKANSNLAILNLLIRLGSGFDIVSIGELIRVIQAGGKAKNIVFSGVAKTTDEITYALEAGIHCFNVESLEELQRINDIAEKLNVKAPVSLRINPNVDAKTHAYISTGLKENKFGISYQLAKKAYQQAAQLPHIEIKGISCHIGSQLTELSPYAEALDCVIELIDALAQEGISLKHLNFGGGLGVRYNDETPPTPQEYIALIKEKLIKYPDLKLIIEPGRAIVAQSGILVTRVEYLKHHENHAFAIVNAGMNNLLRPALYDAWMNIIPVNRQQVAPVVEYDVVGPICETGDFLGKKRKLSIQQGDLLAITDAGAYGTSMSSNYNSRPHVAEVMIDNGQAHVIRRRERLQELWQNEYILP